MYKALLPLLFCFLGALGAPAQEKKLDLEQQADDAVAVQDWVRAINMWRKVTTIRPDYGRGWHMFGYSLHAAGRLDEALQIHLKATGFADVAAVASYNVACVYSLQGEKDKAFEWLEKATEAGFARAATMGQDPDMDNLRGDPRYEAAFAMVKRAAGSTGSVRVFATNTSRGSARLFYWDGDASPGQVRIDYGRPAWQEKFAAQQAETKFTGRRWRLGQNFWTTLDTNVPLELGGVAVPAGYYYLTLEKKGDEQFTLALNDPAAVRKYKLDAFQAHMTRGGIEIPLEFEKVEENAGSLTIGLGKKTGKTSHFALSIHFGPYRLTAPGAAGIKD